MVILKDDTDFETVSLALQREVTDSNYISMHRAREMFNNLIYDHPPSEEYLSPNATIIINAFRHFENAIVKLQSGQEYRLSAPEKHAMARFKIAADTHEENANDEVGEETLSYADRAIMRADRNQRQRLGSSLYSRMSHVSPTSNIVERLFSKAKHVASLRKNMSPYHLELILMLKVNRALWNASTIDQILNDGFSEEKEADSDVDDDI